MKQLIKEISEGIKLYRDSDTGIAFVHDGSTGLSHSCHPNIDSTGSVRGMKKLGYWGKNDVIVRANGYSYNVSRFCVDSSDELDNIAAESCMCSSCVKRRANN